jgi:hypothetical protein
MFPSSTRGHLTTKILFSSPRGGLPFGARGIFINDSEFKALRTSDNRYYLVVSEQGQIASKR